MALFELLDRKGKVIGYKRVSQGKVFGAPYDYSKDSKNWETPERPYEVLIPHFGSKKID